MSALLLEGRGRPWLSVVEGAEEMREDRVDVKFKDEVEEVVMSLLRFGRGTL